MLIEAAVSDLGRRGFTPARSAFDPVETRTIHWSPFGMG